MTNISCYYFNISCYNYYKACYFLNTIIGYNLYEWEILILRSANTSLLNTDFLSIFQTPLSCAKWNIYVIFLSFFSKLIPLHVGLAGIQKNSALYHSDRTWPYNLCINPNASLVFPWPSRWILILERGSIVTSHLVFDGRLSM